MAMRKTWFQHTECTTQEADELVEIYRRRGVEVERSLNADFLTWTVSARLPESDRLPRSERSRKNQVWW